jgi:hypothetical protein
MEAQSLQLKSGRPSLTRSASRNTTGPFESLVAPTKSFGIRATNAAEVFALRLAVGAAKAIDELAAELDRRAS